jgi:phospholipase A1
MTDNKKRPSSRLFFLSGKSSIGRRVGPIISDQLIKSSRTGSRTLPDWKFIGFSNTANQIGVVHQSNGHGGTLSHSWNRIYANLIAERGNLVLAFKPWYRFPEGDDDDNPDITDFMGHYELSAVYKWGQNEFSLMSRNNLESGFSKGAVELG